MCQNAGRGQDVSEAKHQQLTPQQRHTTPLNGAGNVRSRSKLNIFILAKPLWLHQRGFARIKVFNLRIHFIKQMTDDD